MSLVWEYQTPKPSRIWRGSTFDMDGQRSQKWRPWMDQKYGFNPIHVIHLNIIAVDIGLENRWS
jgi:hypothetical protein